MASCFICQKSFKQLDNLEKHFERQHPDEERVCIRCDRSKNVIEYDMIYHDICGKCINKKQCEKCNKYYQKSYLKLHDCSCMKETRYCHQCKIVKPLGEFYISKYKCISCLKEKEECDICCKMILKRNMKHHKVQHQSQSTERRRCNLCKIEKDLNDFFTSHYMHKECYRSKMRAFNNFLLLSKISSKSVQIC